MADERIPGDLGPKQPQPPQQKPLEQGPPPQPFDIKQGEVKQGAAGQSTTQIRSALKTYLKGDEAQNKWSSKGINYTVKRGKDPNPPSGTKNAQLITVTARDKEGNVTGQAQFSVERRREGYYDKFLVFDKPGNRADSDLNTSVLTRIPNNLGKLMRMDPKLGHDLYHSLIVSMAMKMMRDMRKKQQHMFKK